MPSAVRAVQFSDAVPTLMVDVYVTLEVGAVVRRSCRYWSAFRMFWSPVQLVMTWVQVALPQMRETECTLARELPNFSLAGYWWHNFFPDVIRQVMAERLDMLPANKQIGFFSDAYCVEWTYAKAIIARKQLARVLIEKIDQGQFTRDEALATARAILFEAPKSLLGMKPRS